MAEATISHRPFTPEEEGRNEDDQDLEEDDDDREELADDEKDRDTTAPTTPEPPTEDGYQGEVDVYQESIQHIRGKKRARRAKGKKKKQKTSLMITNDDGTDSTTQHLEGSPGAPPRKKVYLRPSNNPLLRAPKNSTQFIIDDHENSQHFLSFQRGEDQEELSEDEMNRLNSVEERETEKRVVGGKDAGDFWIDPFRNAYSEKDFDTVYENAHQEQVYSWERTKIMEEIAILELKQKRLITMLSQIDPVIYLQKLQQELSALQETNRRLKLKNIAERLERNQRGGSRTSSPRLPDSTSGELRSRDSTSLSNSSSSSSSSTGDEDNDEESEVNIGGCSSGCCLASPRRRCDVANLNDVEEENEGGPLGPVEKANEEEDSVEKIGTKNPEVGPDVKEVTKSSSKFEGSDATLDLEKTGGDNSQIEGKKDEENLERVLPGGDIGETNATPSTGHGKEVEISETSRPENAGETTLKKETEAGKEEKLALKDQKEDSNPESRPSGQDFSKP